MKKLLSVSAMAILLLVLCISCKNEIVKPEQQVKVGDVITVSGKQCVVFFVDFDGEHGKAVSLIETTCKWSSDCVPTGTNNESDGVANMDAIMSLPNWKLNYPPFYSAFNIAQNSSFYIPAKDEMELLLSMNSYINPAIEEIDASKVFRTDRMYWTSNEANQNEAYSATFDANGVVTFTANAKTLTTNLYARPICKF